MLTVPVPPSANSWHRVVNGRLILSAAARKYTAGLKIVAACMRWPKIEAPAELAVSIVWYRARKSGDVDKRGAVLLDALQGVCFDNDAQIKRYSIERRDDDPTNPRMEIELVPLTGDTK